MPSIFFYYLKKIECKLIKLLTFGLIDIEPTSHTQVWSSSNGKGRRKSVEVEKFDGKRLTRYRK